MSKFIEGLTMEEYRKLLNKERKTDEPDGELIDFYKFKLGIMPVQRIETELYFTKNSQNSYRITATATEIECNTFEEYLRNLNRDAIYQKEYIINR